MECWVYVCPTEGCAYVALFSIAMVGGRPASTHDADLEVYCPHCLSDDIQLTRTGQTSIPLTLVSA